MAKRYIPRRLQRLRQNDTKPVVKPKWRLVWLFALLALWLICSGAASSHPSAYRLEHYPHWNTKPPIEMAKVELAYPD